MIFCFTACLFTHCYCNAVGLDSVMHCSYLLRVVNSKPDNVSSMVSFQNFVCSK